MALSVSGLTCIGLSALTSPSSCSHHDLHGHLSPDFSLIMLSASCPLLTPSPATFTLTLTSGSLTAARKRDERHARTRGKTKAEYSQQQEGELKEARSKKARGENRRQEPT